MNMLEAEKTVTVIPGFSICILAETNLMEQSVEGSGHTGNVKVEVTPYEIKTLRFLLCQKKCCQTGRFHAAHLPVIPVNITNIKLGNSRVASSSNKWRIFKRNRTMF